MTWATVVKARFLEAADTEKYLQRPQMPGSGNGFWPKWVYTREDRDGWDDQARADEADRWARNRKLTRSAISRHDECLNWSMTLLPTEKHRHIVWRWAFCQANGWSFSDSCKRRGWVRITAYRRLDASFEAVSNFFLGSKLTPTMPEEKYLLQLEARTDTHCVGSAERMDAEPAIKFSPGYRTEESTDLLKSPDEIATFSQHLADVNEVRRKARLRKALRGVPGEVEAA